MKKQLFSAILLSGLFAGCVKEPSPAPGTKTPAGVPVTITASMSESRTSLDGDKSVSWSSGDKIAVYSQIEADGNGHTQQAANSGYQMEFTLSEASAGSKSGEFTGTLIPYEAESEYTDPTYTLHAYYPFDTANAKKKKDVVVGTLPTAQSCDMKGSYDLSAYDFLVGVMKGVKAGRTDLNISFQRVFALMQFRVTNSTGTPFSIKKVEISAAGKALAGDFTIKVHRVLHVVEGTKPGIENKQDGRPVFTAPAEAIAVSVDQGLLPAGATGTVKAMFNRWEDLTNTDLTITVTTNKGTYTKILQTGTRDFSLKDNYILPIDVDALEPLSNVTVDNYIEGSMTLLNSTAATIKQAGGTYCVDGDISIASNISVRGDFTIMGRYKLNGIPQDTLTATFAYNHKNGVGKSIVFKDLIIRPVATTSSNRYIVRIKPSSNTNIGADAEKITFENCIIELVDNSKEQNLSQDYLLAMFGSDATNGNFVAKNLTIKNCVIRNLTTGLITYAGATEAEQSRIGRIELTNNTIYADAATAAEYFRFCGGNVILRNNTFYNYTSPAEGALIAVTAGTVDCSKNIFHTPTPSVLFDAQPAAMTDNCLFNFAAINGGATETTDPQFTAPTTDFTPQNPEVIGATQGDQRWL